MSFKKRMSWLEIPSKVSITRKLARYHPVFLSVNEEITDPGNPFEWS